MPLSSNLQRSSFVNSCVVAYSTFLQNCPARASGVSRGSRLATYLLATPSVLQRLQATPQPTTPPARCIKQSLFVATTQYFALRTSISLFW